MIQHSAEDPLDIGYSDRQEPTSEKHKYLDPNKSNSRAGRYGPKINPHLIFTFNRFFFSQQKTKELFQICCFYFKQTNKVQTKL